MIQCITMLSLLLVSLLAATPPEILPLPPEQIHEIIIHNRILTRVGDRNISLLDVVKSMDVFLSRHYPHYLNSTTARYEFYRMQWRSTLQQMIDNELMAADAASKEITITDGDVREEIQSRFGPNVMGTLDQLGLTYEEARKIVQQEMIVQRIQGFRVTSKVLQKVSSQTVKEAYHQFIQENPPKNVWKYQFATLRASDPATLSAIGNQLIALQEKADKNLNSAAALLKEQLPPDVTLTVSQELETEDRALSQAHRTSLSKLQPGDWSEPILQTGQVRIFHLKRHTQEKPPVFSTLVNQLRMQMLNQTADVEMSTYRAKLYRRFNFDDKSIDIPPHFEPFTAR